MTTMQRWKLSAFGRENRSLVSVPRPVKGSFRRAAERLCLDQSTVSRRVGILERQLGVPLFERSRTGSRAV